MVMQSGSISGSSGFDRPENSNRGSTAILIPLGSPATNFGEQGDGSKPYRIFSNDVTGDSFGFAASGGIGILTEVLPGASGFSCARVACGSHEASANRQ